MLKPSYTCSMHRKMKLRETNKLVITQLEEKSEQALNPEYQNALRLFGEKK